MKLVLNFGRLAGFFHSRIIQLGTNTVLGALFHILQTVYYIISNCSLESQVTFLTSAVVIKDFLKITYILTVTTSCLLLQAASDTHLGHGWLREVSNSNPE